MSLTPKQRATIRAILNTLEAMDQSPAHAASWAGHLRAVCQRVRTDFAMRQHKKPHPPTDARGGE